MTEGMKLSMVAINRWFYFSYNYPIDFIERVWGPRQDYNLTDHLMNKFDALWDRYGSRAVMNEFYAELDGNNRKKLLEWVVANYADEVRLRFEEED